MGFRDDREAARAELDELRAETVRVQRDLDALRADRPGASPSASAWRRALVFGGGMAASCAFAVASDEAGLGATLALPTSLVLGAALGGLLGSRGGDAASTLPAVLVGGLLGALVGVFFLASAVATSSARPAARAVDRSVLAYWAPQATRSDTTVPCRSRA